MNDMFKMSRPPTAREDPKVSHRPTICSCTFPRKTYGPVVELWNMVWSLALTHSILPVASASATSPHHFKHSHVTFFYQSLIAPAPRPIFASPRSRRKDLGFS
ncbi:hypothetical protein BKA66DRAFT_254867 [Pyrenochaeta sp. MPI-SDFR-AT-0127]|nr:hypothetical protein BKA66DRAFT_254867 [Pyrenochaeta sp. MPI-SDFR-AT-0127]